MKLKLSCCLKTDISNVGLFLLCSIKIIVQCSIYRMDTLMKKYDCEEYLSSHCRYLSSPVKRHSFYLLYIHNSFKPSPFLYRQRELQNAVINKAFSEETFCLAEFTFDLIMNFFLISFTYWSPIPEFSELSHGKSQAFPFNLKSRYYTDLKMQLIGYPDQLSPTPPWLFEMAGIRSLKYLNTKLFSTGFSLLDISVITCIDTSYTYFEILKL